MTPVIRTIGLAKRFRGGVDALNGLNLDVPEGSVFGLIGPNGAGKTTTLKILTNILQPTSGTAEVMGVNTCGLMANDFTRIGYVSENQEMPDWMTVQYFLDYLKPFYPSWDDSRATELVRQFSLPLDRKLRHLSRGMKMKAAMISSLAYRPRLLLLDEPFSGLDPMVREDLVEALAESASETTIVISSHDLVDIESFASHIGYLDAGQLRFSEEMTSLSERFREVEVVVEKPAQVPAGAGWPANWLRPETSDALVRFVETQFDAERTNREIRRLFDGVASVSFNPMPLRSIFITPGAQVRPNRVKGEPPNMRQALHILRKDIRYLRLEIGVVLAMAAAFAWMHNRSLYPWWLLLTAACIYMIARLIHAEIIPGDTQFWITRPYRRMSLLGAKLAFILLFVNLPVFIAQLIVFARDGFSFLPHLTGLLWSFGLTFVGVSVPVAALATLTPSIMSFILSGVLAAGIAGSILQNFWLDGAEWPEPVVWIRYSILIGIVIAAALWTVYAQYRTRRTFLNRTIAVAVASVALIVSWQMPFEWGMDMQSRMSKQEFDSALFRVELEPKARRPFSTALGAGQVRLDLPFTILNVPEETNVWMDFANITLTGLDGQVSQPKSFSNGLLQTLSLPRPLFESWLNGPVTVEGLFFLTAFGNPSSESIRVSQDPVDLMHGLQCGIREFRRYSVRSFSCRSPFRWPGFQLSAESGGDSFPIEDEASYFPFPSLIHLNWVWERPVTGRRLRDGQLVGADLEEGQEITLTIREPIAHFWRRIETTINLNDYVMN